MDPVDRKWLLESRVTRRSMLGVVGAAGAAGLLAACGSSSNNTTPAATSAASGGGTTATSAAASGGTTPAATASASPAGSAPGSPAATAVAAATQAPQGKKGGTLTYGYNVQQLLQLDPARISTGRVAGELLPQLFSALVQFDEKLNIVPDLAEKWDISNDGLNYTFHIRQGLKFHNGDPLTAKDFVYTYNRTLDPKLASPHANKLKGITKADAPDDQTFTLTFSAPFAPFLATTCTRGPGRALTPVPQKAVEQIGEDQFLLKPVGCGPFKLVPESMNAQSGFTMEAFDDWYAGRPLLDKIVVKFIPEPSSQVNALAAGDIDAMNEVPPQGYAQLQGNDNVEVLKVHGTNWIAVQFNTATAPFNNQDARMAIAKGIDRDQFIKTALFGLAEPSVGAIAPAFAWATQTEADLKDDPEKFDVDAAKQLAESSGLTKIKPELLAGASDHRNEDTLRNLILKIGVDINLVLLQDADYNNRWQNGQYQMAIQGSVVDADPDDNDYNFFYPDGPWNTGKWNKPEAKQFLDDERATTDQARRAKDFQDLQDLARKEAAFAFLYHAYYLPGFQKYVKGYRQIPEIFYAETIWLDK
ncbi:MAG TPA: ABC transporter substrate-binding protein [Thermomicrobiaceae bacterium]|nr:ABC transporter substrate-binding protein [Thermomicrobiaceae bacterium]